MTDPVSNTKVDSDGETHLMLTYNLYEGYLGEMASIFSSEHLEREVGRGPRGIFMDGFEAAPVPANPSATEESLVPDAPQL